MNKRVLRFPDGLKKAVTLSMDSVDVDVNIVNKNNTLIDGYCTYLVLKEHGVKKFPVIKVGV